MHQFGILLPTEGPDALVGCGLGPAFHLAEHAPYTEGFLPPTETFDEAVTTTIAGLTVEMTPAESDATDSITIWFPELSVAVNNLMWPALFNVFAIRGEEYRDPRVLLAGFDHLIGLGAEHLVGTHGPPISGADHIRSELTRSRDALQFLWDQTVRGVNLGLTHGELTEFVQLPESFGESYFQSQLYGLVEHHVRQIHTGLRGWFDGDTAQLFPVPPVERALRLIAGFGGADEVRRQVDHALDTDDVRWAVELATWLVRVEPGNSGDRARLATALRIDRPAHDGCEHPQLVPHARSGTRRRARHGPLPGPSLPSGPDHVGRPDGARPRPAGTARPAALRSGRTTPARRVPRRLRRSPRTQPCRRTDRWRRRRPGPDDHAGGLGRRAQRRALDRTRAR